MKEGDVAVVRAPGHFHDGKTVVIKRVYAGDAPHLETTPAGELVAQHRVPREEAEKRKLEEETALSYGNVGVMFAELAADGAVYRLDQLTPSDESSYEAVEEEPLYGDDMGYDI